jgi:hypothetical protein
MANILGRKCSPSLPSSYTCIARTGTDAILQRT